MKDFDIPFRGLCPERDRDFDKILSMMDSHTNINSLIELMLTTKGRKEIVESIYKSWRDHSTGKLKTFRYELAGRTLCLIQNYHDQDIESWEEFQRFGFETLADLLDVFRVMNVMNS